MTPRQIQIIKSLQQEERLQDLRIVGAVDLTALRGVFSKQLCIIYTSRHDKPPTFKRAAWLAAIGRPFRIARQSTTAQRIDQFAPDQWGTIGQTLATFLCVPQQDHLVRSSGLDAILVEAMFHPQVQRHLQAHLHAAIELVHRSRAIDAVSCLRAASEMARAIMPQTWFSSSTSDEMEFHKQLDELYSLGPSDPIKQQVVELLLQLQERLQHLAARRAYAATVAELTIRSIISCPKRSSNGLQCVDIKSLAGGGCAMSEWSASLPIPEPTPLDARPIHPPHGSNQEIVLQVRRHLAIIERDTNAGIVHAHVALFTPTSGTLRGAIHFVACYPERLHQFSAPSALHRIGGGTFEVVEPLPIDSESAFGLLTSLTPLTAWVTPQLEGWLNRFIAASPVATQIAKKQLGLSLEAFEDIDASVTKNLKIFSNCQTRQNALINAFASVERAEDMLHGGSWREPHCIRVPSLLRSRDVPSDPRSALNLLFNDGPVARRMVGACKTRVAAALDSIQTGGTPLGRSWAQWVNFNIKNLHECAHKTLVDPITLSETPLVPDPLDLLAPSQGASSIKPNPNLDLDHEGPPVGRTIWAMVGGHDFLF